MNQFNKTLTLILFSLVFCSIVSANKNSVKPSAFADLGDQAFHLLSLDNNKSNQLSFKLDGLSVNIPVISNNKTQSNSFIHQSIDEGHISATQGKNSLFGQMHLKDKHYILTTNQAGIWAVELPESGISYNDCGMDHSHHAAKHDFSHHNFKSIHNTNKNNKAAGTIIDVLVIYDQAIADRYPGDLLQTRVDQYFNVSNQSFVNSAIDLAIRQVGLEQVGYNLDDSNFILLDQLQQSLSLGFGTTGLEDVPQLRETTGADLVVFLRTHNIETRDSCGVAFLPESNNNGFDTSRGVNITVDGMSSWSLCTERTFIHEIGHNLSAGHHNWDPTELGYPIDAKGFAKLGQFSTIMGAFGTGRPDRFLELDYFSNPNVQCGGGPCGVVGQRDNAKIIRQLMGPVSNYQASVSNAPLPADFSIALTDLDGDGVLDSDDKFPYDATETTDSDGDGVGDNGDAFPNNPSENSDFDSDGLGDFSDPDGDNDGVNNSFDTFPFDPTEFMDQDWDGIGQYIDAFGFDSSESVDSDGDGIGNNADNDDDNDGVIDIDDMKQDLLVINVGNNRILRFDAQTGLSKGIEVFPGDGLLTFQSDLAVDQRTQNLFFTSSSSVKILDLMNTNAMPELFLPAYSDTGPQIGTGFPTALGVNENSQFLMVPKIGRTGIDYYEYTNFSSPAQRFLGNLSEAEPENIIDLYQTDDFIYALGQNIKLNRASVGIFDNPENFDFEKIGLRSTPWLVDPYAFVVRGDDIMIHTDQSRNKLVMTDGNDGSFAGIFADIAELGYSNPTGIEITKDGRLLVAVSDQNKILHFNLETGEFIGELVNGFGLDQPHKMVLVPQLQDRFHKDADKTLRPNAGGWFNLASSGRGLNIGIFNNRIQILWFTFDEQGEPIWYSAADFLIGNEFSSQLLKNTISDDGELLFETVGQIDLTFDNEREAFFEWQLGEDSGSEPLTWLQSSGEPDVADYTGLWSRPDTPGWGLAVNTNGDFTFTIAFIYDEAGEPRWAISDVFSGLGPLTFDMVTVFSEGLCPTCTGDISTTRVDSGTMTLILDDEGSSWSSDFLWADPVPGGWPLNDTEIIRISSPPTRPR